MGDLEFYVLGTRIILLDCKYLARHRNEQVTQNE